MGYRDERLLLEEQLLKLESDHAALAGRLRGLRHQLEFGASDLEDRREKIQRLSTGQRWELRLERWSKVLLPTFLFPLLAIAAGYGIYYTSMIHITASTILGSQQCNVTVDELQSTCEAQVVCGGKVLLHEEGKCAEIHGASFWSRSESESFVLISRKREAYWKKNEKRVTFSLIDMTVD